MKRTLLVFWLACMGALYAQSLPSAESLLDREVEVTGGQHAYESIQSLIVKSTYVYPKLGAQGGQILYLAKGDLLYMFVYVGKNSVESGIKGGVAWEKSTVKPPRILGSIERAQLLRGTIDAASKWRQLYSKVETVGEETVDSQPCYKVVATPVEGNPETIFLSQKDGWVIKYATVYVIQNQNVAMNLTLSDYKRFGDILVPTKLIQKSKDLEFIATIDSVEINPVIPKNRFNLLADVLALSPRRAK